jgi:hypothetical protein
VKAGVALALIAFIAIVGTVAMDATDSADNTKTVDTHRARPTTSIDNATVCKMELAGWLDFALAPGGSLTAAGAEYGLASPEYKAIETAWSKFAENLYVVGADNATTIAVQSLDADCDTIGDSYVPGHIPPN